MHSETRFEGHLVVPVDSAKSYTLSSRLRSSKLKKKQYLQNGYCNAQSISNKKITY